eukprot:g424.t1
MHSFLSRRYPGILENFLQLSNTPGSYKVEYENTTEHIAQSLADAFTGFTSRYPLTQHKRRKMNNETQTENVEMKDKGQTLSNLTNAIAFIVLPNETNTADQNLLEHEIFMKDNRDIPVLRLTLQDIYENYTLEEGTNHLCSTDYRLCVCYFRAGYDASHYSMCPEDTLTSSKPAWFKGKTYTKQWEGRYLIECSTALKCPDVFTQLTGTKKVQQILCEPNTVERYLDPSLSQDLRQCFAYQCIPTSIEANNNIEKASTTATTAPCQTGYTPESATQEAYNEPAGWVLKPQREGGGNNLWGKELVHALQTFSAVDLKAHVLMKKIHCPSSLGVLMFREGTSSQGLISNEIGIYGTYVRLPKENEISSKYAGYLVRSKFSGENEGGVAAGYACLSSLAFQ